MVLSIVMPIMMGVAWLLLDKTETFFHHQVDQHLDDNLLVIETKLLGKRDEIKRICDVIANRTSIQKILHLGSSLGINQTLNKIMKIYPYFNYLLIVDKEGEIYAANTLNADGKKIYGELLLGLNVKSVMGYEKLLDNKPSIGIPSVDPYLSTMDLSSTQSLWFSAPVYRGRHLLGWVVISYNWYDQINTLLQQTKQHLLEQKDPVIELLLLDHEQLYFSRRSTWQCVVIC